MASLNGSKILVLGRGFIGDRVGRAFGAHVSPTAVGTMSDLEQVFKDYRPSVVINAIGHTGKHNVDDCERDRDRTLFANSYVPLLLAEACLRRNIKLVHLSSGCIYHYDYDEDQPIPEERKPDYTNLYYSRTKIYAEEALSAVADRYGFLILRLRIPLDYLPHPRNILTKLLNFSTVIDVPNSITYLPCFICALGHLIRIDAKGVFNVVSKGALRYPELLDIYRRYVPGFSYRVGDIRQARTNLILATDRLEATGLAVPDIHDVLEPCVRRYVQEVNRGC